jgi:hypothetical protein
LHDRPDRRQFLARLSALAAAAGGVRWLSGCSGSSGADPAALAEEARRLGTGLQCTDTTGLQDAEVLTRTRNEYMERSTTAGRYCFNCDNYRKPAAAGECATCTTVRGPINPGGGCKSWTKARGR